MRLLLTVAGCVLLVGCAKDNYRVAQDSGADASAMSATLTVCKREAIHAYTTSHYANGGAAAVLAGGAVAGPVGSTLANQMANPDQMKTSEINPYVERCMAAKGYIGTSEN